MHEKEKKPVGGEDVVLAIRGVHPRGVVTDSFLYDGDSYYDKIREKVRAALGTVKGACLLYDRPPEGRPHWSEDSDPDEDPPDWDEMASSYDLLFFALGGKQFEFEGEFEEEDWPEDEDADEPVLVSRPTEGKVGLAVGISVVAPFAAICLSDMEFAHSGYESLPSIDSIPQCKNEPIEKVEARYVKEYGKEGLKAILDLEHAITRVLHKFGIRVLSHPELRTRIPCLKPDPKMSFRPAKSATVYEALFFQTFG
jgi:hypothetical protein